MIHSALRLLSISAPFVSIPVLALLCVMVSKTAAIGYLAFLGGRPLPALTRVWIIEITQSALFVPAAAIIAISLWFSALYLLKKEGRWTLTGVLLVCSIGFTISLLLVGTTCFSAVLPLMALNATIEP
jgi:hypothetical protein